MNIQRELERRINKKQQEIAELERQLSEATAYLGALLDTTKLFPKDANGAAKEVALRTGTDLARARDLIKKSGNALHIDEILKGLGKELTKGNKISLSGSLAGYARRGVIFSKPEPNTFGLIELETCDTDTLVAAIEPEVQAVFQHGAVKRPGIKPGL